MKLDKINKIKNNNRNNKENDYTIILRGNFNRTQIK